MYIELIATRHCACRVLSLKFVRVSFIYILGSLISIEIFNGYMDTIDIFKGLIEYTEFDSHRFSFRDCMILI